VLCEPLLEEPVLCEPLVDEPLPCDPPKLPVCDGGLHDRVGPDDGDGGRYDRGGG